MGDRGAKKGKIDQTYLGFGSTIKLPVYTFSARVGPALGFTSDIFLRPHGVMQKVFMSRDPCDSFESLFYHFLYRIRLQYMRETLDSLRISALSLCIHIWISATAGHPHLTPSSVYLFAFKPATLSNHASLIFSKSSFIFPLKWPLTTPVAKVALATWISIGIGTIFRFFNSVSDSHIISEHSEP